MTVYYQSSVGGTSGSENSPLLKRNLSCSVSARRSQRWAETAPDSVHAPAPDQ